jgi:hypothetical protein
MRKHYTAICIGCLALTASTSVAGVFIDDFTATELDPRWTLNDSVDSYDTPAGGGHSLDGSYVRFDKMYQHGFAHIQTPVDTSEGIRVDAIIRTDNYNAVDWGIGASIYYDDGNWAGIRLIGENGEGVYDGWMSSVMSNGVLTSTFLHTEDKAYLFDFRIGGVELTDTEIKFYGTDTWPNVPPGKYETNGKADLIDTDTVLLHTTAKPSTFTGEALAIIGKGFSGSVGGMDYLEPQFKNLGPPPIFEYGAFNGINLVRITTPGDDGLVGDYNGDNSVDAADYTTWRDNFGSSNVLQNDPIGGTIGTGQYEQWKLHFGSSGSGSGSLGVVPEPGTAILAIIASLTFILSTSRRRHHSP